MKRIKLSENELLAVVFNSYRELGFAFESLDAKSKEASRLKKQILADLAALLSKEYSLDLTKNSYDVFFKTDKVLTSEC